MVEDVALAAEEEGGMAAGYYRDVQYSHLAPELDSRPFTAEEDEEIIRKQREFGNKWATIARHLRGRSDNAVKNRWNSTLRKQQPGLGAHDQEDVAAAAADGQAGLDDLPPRAVPFEGRGHGGRGCGGGR
ncbi:hypothetical protein ACQ4PT_051181 [Festuca glaucescens]